MIHVHVARARNINTAVVNSITMILGVLSFLYYLLMLWYTKRASTTFSGFWIAFGVISIGVSLLMQWLPNWLQNFTKMLILMMLCLFVFVEFFICKAMFQKPQKGLDYLIVLGAQVRGTRITNSLERRLKMALLYLQENPKTKVIVSGGQGKGEAIPEALAMSRYLEIQGVETSRIFVEDQSRTTKENLLFSKAYVDYGTLLVGVVTNNFHVYRALVIGKRVGYKNLSGISASSNPILFFNYVVREFFAVFQLWFLQKSVDK